MSATPSSPRTSSPRTFIEKFDDGPCGWISWGTGGPFGVEIHDGMAVSRSPWWVDYNHGPPGAGYLHMPFMLHLRNSPQYGANPNIVKIAGPNSFFKSGLSTNLTNAKVTVRVKGQVNPRGAKMVLLAQNNLPTPERPMNWVNQVLSAQPIMITPEWSTQTIHLVPDQAQWTNMGSHRTRADRYGVGPIARLLDDVDDIIFVFTPLDVAPAKPIDGDPHLLRAGADYEVDRSRLPEGTVMLDEVKIELA